MKNSHYNFENCHLIVSFKFNIVILKKIIEDHFLIHNKEIILLFQNASPKVNFKFIRIHFVIMKNITKGYY